MLRKISLATLGFCLLLAPNVHAVCAVPPLSFPIQSSGHATVEDCPSHGACEAKAIKYCNSNLRELISQASNTCQTYCSSQGCHAVVYPGFQGCRYLEDRIVEDDGDYKVCLAIGEASFRCKCV